MKKTLLALAILAAASSVHAQEAQPAPAKSVSGFVGLGITGGGKKLATADYTDGHSANIKSGGGVYFTGGLDVQITEQFSAQTSINFHVDDQTAQNGSLKFQRFPIEALAFYHIDNNWKIGTGVRYVTGAKLSGSGVADIDDLKFKNTLSGVVEAEYMFSPQLSVKMRYVKEKLEVKDYYYYGEVKANHFGISGNFYF